MIQRACRGEEARPLPDSAAAFVIRARAQPDAGQLQGLRRKPRWPGTTDRPGLPTSAGDIRHARPRIVDAQPPRSFITDNSARLTAATSPSRKECRIDLRGLITSRACQVQLISSDRIELDLHADRASDAGEVTEVAGGDRGLMADGGCDHYGVDGIGGAGGGASYSGGPADPLVVGYHDGGPRFSSLLFCLHQPRALVGGCAPALTCDNAQTCNSTWIVQGMPRTGCATGGRGVDGKRPGGPALAAVLACRSLGALGASLAPSLTRSGLLNGVIHSCCG